MRISSVFIDDKKRKTIRNGVGMCLHRESDKKKGITFGGVQRPLGRPTLALVSSIFGLIYELDARPCSLLLRQAIV